MANPSRALAEAALRTRKLDRTLTTARPEGGLEGERVERASTGIALLDSRLGGGLPRGHLSEIAGPQSSGRTAVLLQVLSAATGRGEIAALVDTFDRFDVASAASAGVALDRLLWIRGDALSSAEARRLPEALVDRTVERALKALNLVLQAGGFGVVAIDLADAPPAALRRLPFTTWLRLQRVLEGRDTSCLLVAGQPLARSAGGVTLALAAGSRWTSSLLTGLDITARVISPRQQVDGAATLGARVHGCSGAQVQVQGSGCSGFGA